MLGIGCLLLLALEAELLRELLTDGVLDLLTEGHLGQL